jgi:hypothetical protein
MIIIAVSTNAPSVEKTSAGTGKRGRNKGNKGQSPEERQTNMKRYVARKHYRQTVRGTGS